MTAFDIYIFTLSLLIIVLLSALSIAVIVIIMKLSCKLIRSGAEDDNILAEVNKTQSKGEKIGKIIDQTISLIFAVVFLVAFALSTMVACTKNVSLGNVPVFRVVNSDSMSKKHEKNDYLVENNLNNQFDTFDLIITYDVPPEEELKLYDVVVYKYEDMLIVHRIVQIVTTRNGEKYYMLQGDNEPRADIMPVYYSQMVAIYRGERIPFVGSFVKFMQSPAGWICIVLVMLAMIAGPIADKKLANERAKRLNILQTANSLLTKEPLNYNGEEELENKPTTQVGTIIMQGNGEVEIKPSKMEEQAKTELAITESEELCKAEIIEESEKVYKAEIIEENQVPFAFHMLSKNNLSFSEKLENSSSVVKERYAQIINYLKRIDGVRVIKGKKFETYKCKSKPLIRLSLRGKTLNAYIALNCKDYENTKYIFEDVSSSKTYKNYPMRVKVTSNRKARWVIELLENIVAYYGLTVNAESEKVYRAEIIEENQVPFAFHMLSKNNLSFSEKLENSSSVVKERYAQIINYLKRIDGVRVIKGKKFETYKCKSKPLIRLSLRGKTLNAYIALNCKDYENTKYIFEDVSSSKTYKNYPMRVKVTSNRKTRWVVELLQEISTKNNLTVNKEPIEIGFKDFNKRYKKRSFIGRLRKLSKESVIRLKAVTDYLKSINKVVEKKSSEHRVYKLKGKPIVKVLIKGKTVCLYFAIKPSKLEGSKYVYKNVENVKKYNRYPTLFKLTSNRQAKWSIEVIDMIINGIVGGVL